MRVVMENDNMILMPACSLLPHVLLTADNRAFRYQGV